MAGLLSTAVWVLTPLKFPAPGGQSSFPDSLRHLPSTQQTFKHFLDHISLFGFLMIGLVTPKSKFLTLAPEAFCSELDFP